MNLFELTEPLFQYVCRLNRVARKGASVDFENVRAEVRAIFEKMAERAQGDLRLSQQYRAIEAPLTFFVDSVIAESRLHFAMEWNMKRLAYERQELAGDERFFELLDETLKERGDEAAERLVVFYTCIGLGFSGWYSGQPEVLKRKMLEIAPRIRSYIESDEAARICPDAYEYTNTTDLVLPPASRIWPWVIGVTVLILAVGVVYWDSFRSGAAELHQAIETITKNEPDGGNR